MKSEHKQGPMNEIYLEPRITPIHYHERREPTVHGIRHGPILNVTSDGEAELPPGETLQSSRGPSCNHISNSITRNSRSSNDFPASTCSGDAAPDGIWRTALQQPSAEGKGKNKVASSRFSSFREDEITTGESEAEDSGLGTPTEAAQKRWSMLRHRVLPSRSSFGGNPKEPMPGKVSALAPTVITSVPVTTELFAGQLPVMILKTWIDRDEDGRKAVPVLLGNLRFRVGDSIGLKQGREATGKEMFKVECEYGDGAVKWVIFRELRDFLSLHAHYKAANFGTSVAGLRSARRVEIPDFPLTSIPYLNKFERTSGGKDKEKTKHIDKAEHAQASRNALQQYLVELIRAVIFRPESNRLCKFFELSALTLALAPRGGFQGKAGFLKIPGSNASRRANQPGLTPQSWKVSKKPKWFIVRDSYCVATDGPEITDFYDVFLFDTDFTIIRPKRYYRQGINILSGHAAVKHVKPKVGSDTSNDNNIAEHVDTDNSFNREVIVKSGEGQEFKAQKIHDEAEHEASQHTFYIVNSQRKLKLVAKNARQMHQFIVSMERIASQCVWTKHNRFDSFAPLRVNVAAQWLVDGRDYFWNLSRAINMAKDRIYIHDWWISPELYLRRPGDERYRLDNLLKRKAEDGVKIFIIIYNEVSDKTTPVDSQYTKRTLMDLHPNIMVQRSPSHFQTGTFYWSHHEKLCVIDETLAFMGGLDLCYGRWDTPQHVLLDEEFTEPDGPNGPVWRGKDYANERVMEYTNLDKPFEDMFDRTKVPRMPWHDVGLQIVGQPSRDLCRHFVQRWNLLIRTKNHKRRMPFLLPAADFTERELQDLKLQGTCEVQICRSVGPWSMGTSTKIEHSIQNAYCKSIETSEHFVYIENQFFITSTIVDGVDVENGIGDSLVNRIIHAHKEGQDWRACIVIPLLPGYTYPLDSNEASSVRLILECQNRTISRGMSSIFSRLRKVGIDPDNYITFFSLRGWSKFKTGVLTSEQVYIHGKTMIVDDRLVLCGSANINERSQRGDRDSELLAVIRDTDMIDGTMAGRSYKVGRFAHTLRVRLMREHVGVDVDALDEEHLMFREPLAEVDEVEIWDPDHKQQSDDEAGNGITQVKKRAARERLMNTFSTGMASVTKGMSENAISNIKKTADKIVHPVTVVASGQTAVHHQFDVDSQSEREDYQPEGGTSKGFASSMVPTLEEKTIFEHRPNAQHPNGKRLFDLQEEYDQQGGRDIVQTKSGEGGEEPNEAEVPRESKEHAKLLDVDSTAQKSGVSQLQIGPSNKELFSIPVKLSASNDDLPVRVTDRGADDEGKGMEEGQAALKARKILRKHLNAKVQVSPWSMPTPTPDIDPNRFIDPLDEKFWKNMWVATAVHNTEIFRKVFRCIPDDLVTSWAQYKAFANHAEKFNKEPEDVAQGGSDEPVKVTHNGPGTHGAGGGGSGGGQIGTIPRDKGSSRSEMISSDVVNGKPKDHLGLGAAANRSPIKGGEAKREAEREKKPSQPDEAWAEWERDEMEKLLNEVRGHLVIYPTRFLEAEDLANNFLFNILPLPIYD
uniref:Phospholipase n=1 Tax=Cryptococcus deneoformans TaxID=40410 RepID=Q8J0Y6_9TREE|nr:SPO14 [Cryptococcus neoformans var. neoformans]